MTHICCGILQVLRIRKRGFLPPPHFTPFYFTLKFFFVLTEVTTSATDNVDSQKDKRNHETFVYLTSGLRL